MPKSADGEAEALTLTAFACPAMRSPGATHK